MKRQPGACRGTGRRRESGACPACGDQETGSAVIGQLDNGPVVFQLVLNALDPATARYPNCLDEYPARA
jgi:hypothetical protein